MMRNFLKIAKKKSIAIDTIMHYWLMRVKLFNPGLKHISCASKKQKRKSKTHKIAKTKKKQNQSNIYNSKVMIAQEIVLLISAILTSWRHVYCV